MSDWADLTYTERLSVLRILEIAELHSTGACGCSDYEDCGRYCGSRIGVALSQAPAGELRRRLRAAIELLDRS